MRCEQARALFDAYVDGELSDALATEVGAHRVHCPECRRALALLEVTGHIIASDQDPVEISADFSDRLLACVEKSNSSWWRRAQRYAYIAAPVAAAAVVALAFLGAFDQREAIVKGVRVESGIGEEDLEELDAILAPTDGDSNAATQALDRWGRHLQEASRAKRQSVETLLQGVDMTIAQWLDVLEQAGQKVPVEDHFPGAVPATSMPPAEDVHRSDSGDSDAR